MEFDLFEKGIRVLVDRQEGLDAIHNLANKLFNHFLLIPKGATDDYILHSLCHWSKQADALDVLQYFVYDLDFGRKWVKGTVVDQGRDIKLSTIEDVYNYLDGKPNYLK